ncbi:MAG: hypothetical protein ACI4JR_01635, partial [Acutalibacteraceae bacterium]
QKLENNKTFFLDCVRKVTILSRIRKRFPDALRMTDFYFCGIWQTYIYSIQIFVIQGSQRYPAFRHFWG